MKKIRVLLILGLWIAILPYLGFPSTWKNILFSLSGMTLVYFSYMMYVGTKSKKIAKKSFENFSENQNFPEDLPSPHVENN